MYRSLGTKIFSAFIVFLLAFFASPDMTADEVFVKVWDEVEKLR